MKKKVVGSGVAKTDGPSHLAAMESNVFCKLMGLVAHCAVTKYEDGDPRKPGWCTVKTMGSAWVIQVKDPDTCLQLSAVGQSLDDALALIDILLTSEEAPWEPDPFARSQQSKSKAKSS
jgi:hypothetical protein